MIGFICVPFKIIIFPIFFSILPCLARMAPQDLGIAFASAGNEKIFTLEKNILKQLLVALKVSQDSTRVAALTYGEKVRQNFQLNQYDSYTSVANAIDVITNGAPGSTIREALNMINSDMLSERRGARLGVPKIVIFFLTAKAKETFGNELQNLQSKGVKIIAIGIGNDYDKQDLVLLGSGTGKYFEIRNVGLDQGIIDIIIQATKKGLSSRF